MNQTRHGDNSWFSLAAIPWVILGIFLNPMFIGVAGMMLAASHQRNRLLSGLLVGFDVLFLLFVLGYGIGKDLAYRDAAVAKGAVSVSR